MCRSPHRGHVRLHHCAWAMAGRSRSARGPCRARDRDGRPVSDFNPRAKPRVIVTTDPELDDLNSMLRLLLYSNEIDIAALVYSASQFHHAGDFTKGIRPHRWPAPGEKWHIDV